MTASARHALELIRECVEEGRYTLTPHFSRRMDGRGLFWPDVVAVIENPRDVRSGGLDDGGRPKWLVAGRVSDGLAIEFVCILDIDENGNTTLFVTIYWD